MVFTLIGFLIILIGVHNFKKGFYLFLFYKLVLVTNITVISLPGIPLLTLDVFMTMMYFLLYYQKRWAIHIETLPLPYAMPFVLITLSYFLSTIFAYVGFTVAFSQYVGEVVCGFGFVWLMWKVIDINDLDYLVKGFTFMFLLACIYGFYEKLTQSNPIVLYEMTLMGDSDRMIDFLVTDDSFRGYRVQSFFEHAIGGGVNWGMFAAFAFTMLMTYEIQLSNIQKSFLTLTAFLCIPCLFFANNRGSIVFFFVAILAAVNLGKSKFYERFLGVCVLFIIVAPFFTEYTNNILSIFDSNVQEKVGGSNIQMRFDQLAASIEVMKESPFVGLGYKFMNIMKTAQVAALLGLESMWFRILTQFGLLGVVVNLVLAYYSLIKLPLRYKSLPMFFFSLAYWITTSLTSVPGMKMYFYYFVLIIFIKISNVYQLEKDTTVQ